MIYNRAGLSPDYRGSERRVRQPLEYQPSGHQPLAQRVAEGHSTLMRPAGPPASPDWLDRAYARQAARPPAAPVAASPATAAPAFGAREVLRRAFANRTATATNSPTLPSVQAPTQSMMAPPQQEQQRQREAPTSGSSDPLEAFLELTYNRHRGKGSGGAATRRALMQLQAGLVKSQLPGFLDSIEDLRAQSDPEQLASLFAPSLEGLNDSYRQSQGAVELALNRQGLQDSGFAAAAQARLASDNNRARAGIHADISRMAIDRGDMLRQVLSNLISGNVAGAQSAANSIRQDRFQQQQIDAMEGSFLDTLTQLGVAGAQIARYT